MKIQVSYTSTYKEELKHLIQSIAFKVNEGNTSLSYFLDSLKKELISLNKYDSLSFQKKPKSKKKFRIANAPKEDWQPKVVYCEKSFTSMSHLPKTILKII